jgi:hypothetical protein
VKAAELGNMLKDMQQHGIIKESKRPHPHPEKNEDLLFCADYRKLNEVTKKKRFPLT